VSKQLEFDFEQYNEPRRVSAPVTEYFRNAFGMEIIADPNMRRGQVAFVQKGALRGRIEDGAAVDDKAFSSDPILSTDSAERKQTPIFSGVLMYFPLAIAAVARHSKRGNDKHNSGEPLHWARAKSDDHADCIARHLVDVEHYNAELGEYEEACALAWRALAKLQLLEERRLGRSK
jgi:hypothetical protein